MPSIEMIVGIEEYFWNYLYQTLHSMHRDIAWQISCIQDCCPDMEPKREGWIGSFEISKIELLKQCAKVKSEVYQLAIEIKSNTNKK